MPINNGITEDRSRDYKSIGIGDFARREMSGSLEGREGGGVKLEISGISIRTNVA